MTDSFVAARFSLLVVEDDPLSRALIVRILEEEGFHVESVGCSVEALQKVEEHSFDLILLDIVLPDIDGLQLLLKLRDLGVPYRTPIIVLTGQSDSASKREAFSLGVVDYITKPYLDFDVIARVRVHLKNIYNTRLLAKQQTEHIRQIEKIKQSIATNPQKAFAARFSVFYRSLREIGGDFYDVVPLGEDIWAYTIADASGHDIGTSYLAPAYKALFRQNASILNSPAETMEMINRVLCAVFEDERYVTALSLVINRRTGKMLWSTAGHPAPLIIRGKQVELLKGDGFVMGVFSNVSYELYEYNLKKGDRIILFSDGLIERNDGIPWTESQESLVRVAVTLSAVPLKDIPEKLYDAVVKACCAPDDDVTIVAIEM